MTVRWLPALGNRAQRVPTEPHHTAQQWPGCGCEPPRHPRAEAPRSHARALCVLGRHRANADTPGVLPHPPPARSHAATPGGTSRICDPVPGLQIRFLLSSGRVSRAASGGGARSQHLLHSPEPAPAGGPRESLQEGCVHEKGVRRLDQEPAHISQPTDAGWPAALTLLPQGPRRPPRRPLCDRPEKR